MKKDKYIVSWNLAGYGWKISNENWGDRLKRACNYIKEVYYSALGAEICRKSEHIDKVKEVYMALTFSGFKQYISRTEKV